MTYTPDDVHWLLDRTEQRVLDQMRVKQVLVRTKQGDVIANILDIHNAGDGQVVVIAGV